jgi:hypothetical protein
MAKMKMGWKVFSWFLDTFAVSYGPAVLTMFIIMLRPEWYNAVGFNLVAVVPIFVLVFVIHRFIALPVYGGLAKIYRPNFIGLTGAGIVIGTIVVAIFLLLHFSVGLLAEAAIWEEVVWVFGFSLIGSWYSWVMVQIT